MSLKGGNRAKARSDDDPAGVRENFAAVAG